MAELAFSKQVLGRFASYRLETKGVTQTIRSDTEIKGLKVGDDVAVTLDGVVIGKAKIVSIDKVRLSELTREDAQKGGFEGVISELEKALHRAGFRFKPLNEYIENRVRFEWLTYGSHEATEVKEKALEVSKKIKEALERLTRE